MVAPQTASSDAGGRRRKKRRISRFWDRLSDGLEVQQLWEQFRSEARTSYDLYRQDVDWDAVGKRWRFSYAMRVAREIFWVTVMKLSPARRVLLVASLLLWVMGEARIGVHGTTLDLDFRGLGFLLLLLVLGLELADRVTMKRDLQIAREIQRWLVPEQPPHLPGLDIAFTTRPANTVSGDYYDAFLVDPDGQRLLLVVADVAGKSVPAALLMSSFQACLHSCARDCEGPLELAARLNEFTCSRSLDGRRFTTAFLAELHLGTRELRYVNAGHNPPVLQRADGSVERLEHGGLPFGIHADEPYRSGSVALGSGDLLFVFTDGVIDAVDAAGHEYGEPRVLATLAGLKGQDASATIRAVIAAIDAFVGTTRQTDDITCLVMRTA